MINLVRNKDLIWETDNYDVILVGTSIYCMLSNGFQGKINLKYPFLEEENNKTSYGNLNKLGTRITINKENTPIISLMYICKHPHKTREFISYDALEQCLRTAMAEFKGKKIATTLLGCSVFDGNGDKDKILNIIEDCTKGYNLDVYDYKQLDKNDEIELIKRKIISTKDTNPEKYQEMWNKREEIFKQMYLK